MSNKEKKLHSKLKFVLVGILAVLLIVGVWAIYGFRRARANEFKISGVKEMQIWFL